MKNTLRALVASVLAVMMIFSLAACSGKDTSGGTGAPAASGTGGKPGGKTGGKDSVPAFVYVSSFETIANDNKPLGVTSFTDEGFYATSSDVVGQREPEEGEIQEWEGQFDIVEESLYFVTYDGKRSKLESYEPFKSETAEGHTAGAELNALTADADGNLAALYHVWDNWNDAPEGMSEENPDYWNYFHYEENWYLRTMDPSGAEQSLAPIKTNDGEWFWPSGLAYVDGKVLVAANNSVRIYGADGAQSGEITTNGYVSSLITLRDGRPCLAFREDPSGNLKLAAIDLSSGRVSQTWNCPNEAYNFISGGGDYDLYYQSGINIYGYKLENESGEKLFDWLNVDVLQQNLSGYTVRPDGTVFGVTNTWDSKWENVTTEFVTVVKKAYADVPQKEELTLACQWTDINLQNAVIRFNRGSNVRINVIDYSQYNTEEDYTAGLTKLTTEIMSGNLPDILALEGLPYQQLAAKGLLEDLYPYMEKDSEISRTDFLPNVLQALEVNEKLYSTVSTFNIVTLAGSSTVVGDKPGWTADDLLAALNTMPQGCTVLDQFTTSGDILRDVLTLDADYYIDWTTGSCRFDQGEFARLLEFAKLFPNAFDSMSFNWDEYESDEQRIREGRQMLTRMYLSSFDDLARYEAVFGGNVTYIGFPTNSGVGSYMNINSGYGMSANCADKEAAWQFLRLFMSEKALENGSYYWGFPANRKLLDKQLKEAMTIEYVKDEKGNYLLDDNGERIPVSRGGFWMEGMDEPMQIYALTQEQADKIMEVINSTTKLYSQNRAVLDIISEQTDAFFSGQKSADEVAKLVQGKLSIYVNEQR